MQEYDVALKLLLQGSPRMIMSALAGAPIEKWEDIELPKVQNPRVDLLGRTAGGELIHIELQSGNDPLMPLRMLEYRIGIFGYAGSGRAKCFSMWVRRPFGWRLCCVSPA